jgi:hypothetical protein
MTNGRLEKPVYQLPLGFDLVEIDEAAQEDERVSSEAALAALSALRIKEPIYETRYQRDSEADELVEKVVRVGEREVEPRWMELYKRLIEGGWKWRVAVYIAWAAQPKKYRFPNTQEELATQCLGLNSDRAIATWRKKNPTIDETISMLQGSIIFDALPDAFNAMVEVATDSNYKGHADRKLLFEMAQVYTPSSKITAELAKKLKRSGSDKEYSDDELREIAALANNELESRATPSVLRTSPPNSESTNLGENEQEDNE